MLPLDPILGVLQFEHYGPKDMIDELRRMFEKPPAAELYDLIEPLHECKQEAGKSVIVHVLEMKRYLDQLDRLGCGYQESVFIGLILRSLNQDLYSEFVCNYNMHCKGNTISEVLAMLIDFEKGLSKKTPTLAVMAIQSGRITKKKPNKPQNANNKGKGTGNGKGKQVATHHRRLRSKFLLLRRRKLPTRIWLLVTIATLLVIGRGTGHCY